MPRRRKSAGPAPASLTDRRPRLLRGAAGAILGLAGIALAVARLSAGPGDAPNPGFRLRESAKRLGIDFRHETSDFDPRVANIMPWLTFGGASVTVTDANGDGWPDLYVTNSAIGSRNRLYVNRGDGTFEEAGERAGIADVNRPGTGVSTNAVWADFDGDGRDDLLLVKYGYLELYHNDGGLHFTRVTEEAGLGKQWIYANDALAWDYDGDGCLDIYVGAYFRPENDLWHLTTTDILQDDYENSRNGGPNKLFKGDCHGKFRDVSAETGLDDRGWTLAVGAADLDGDGRPDLYVANDYGYDRLLFNEGGGRFTDRRESHGLGSDTKKGMNVSFGDFNNSGRLSIYVTNLTKHGRLVEGNMLWENQGGRNFRDVAWDRGAADGGWGWGAQFGDLNNDGFPDLFAVNGLISADPAKDYWYELANLSNGPGYLARDAANWPAIGTRSISGYERSRVFLGNAWGRFRESAAAAGVDDLFDGRGAALVDLNHDGTLDVVVANQRGPLLVYLNTVDPGRHWIQFELRDARGRRNPIGARLTLYWDGKKQLQELYGGGGFAGKSERIFHFGLGGATAIERAEIRWPDGKSQIVEGKNLAVDGRRLIEERP